MTACPCAQELVADAARERLVEQGFTDDEIERVFDAVPVATHNQRGIGRLCIGCPEGCDAELRAETLLRIVEDSMSSEIFELMKRSDERAVVEKAHRRPRFVEDCVREMLRGVVVGLSGARTPSAFVLARQENLETIHQHNVVAERYGLFGEITRRARLRPPLAASRDDAGVAGEPVAGSRLSPAPRLAPCAAARRRSSPRPTRP